MGQSVPAAPPKKTDTPGKPPEGKPRARGFLRQYELVEKVKAYQPDADEDALNKAYVFATVKHGAQLRHSGDPYYAHPVAVAGLLTDLRLIRRRSSPGCCTTRSRTPRLQSRKSASCLAMRWPIWSMVSPRCRG